MNFRIVFQLILITCYFSNKEVYSQKLVEGATKMYYLQLQQELTWAESLNFCKNMSMDLFSVRNEEDFTFLKSAVQRSNGYVPRFWLGLYRFDGIFRWLPDGEKITRFFWHEGEPNNKSAIEDCIHTWDQEFDWNDNDCDSKHHCICERNL